MPMSKNAIFSMPWSINNRLLVADLPPCGSDRWEMDVSIRQVEALLNYKFNNKKLLEDALTHPSYTASASYQRLECLGDNAIALIVSSYVFLAYPDAEAGEMSLIRSANVSTEKLARVAVKHGFYKYVRHSAVALDRLIREFVVAVEKEEDGEELYGGMVKAPKVLADIVESIAAAIYVDCGMNVEKLWMSFRRLMEPFITLDLLQQQQQPVTSLFELCQKEGKQVKIKHKRKGDKTITSVCVDGILLASASSKQKEHAKLKASKIALETLFQKSITMNAIDINDEDENGKRDEKKRRLKVSTDIMNDHKQSDEMETSKKKLHELCDKKRWPRPKYRIQKQTGPPHDRRVVCLVQIEFVKDKMVMHGEEKSRVKDAESSAAYAMLQALQSSNYI